LLAEFVDCGVCVKTGSVHVLVARTGVCNKNVFLNAQNVSKFSTDNSAGFLKTLLNLNSEFLVRSCLDPLGDALVRGDAVVVSVDFWQSFERFGSKAGLDVVDQREENDVGK